MPVDTSDAPGDLAPEEILDAVDLVTEVGLDPVRVEVGDLQHPGEPFRLGGQAVLAVSSVIRGRRERV